MALRDALSRFLRPTAVAVEIIEGFEGDDAKELVRALADAAPASEG